MKALVVWSRVMDPFVALNVEAPPTVRVVSATWLMLPAAEADSTPVTVPLPRTNARLLPTVTLPVPLLVSVTAPLNALAPPSAIPPFVALKLERSTHGDCCVGRLGCVARAGDREVAHGDAHVAQREGMRVVQRRVVAPGVRQRHRARQVVGSTQSDGTVGGAEGRGASSGDGGVCGLGDVARDGEGQMPLPTLKLPNVRSCPLRTVTLFAPVLVSVTAPLKALTPPSVIAPFVALKVEAAETLMTGLAAWVRLPAVVTVRLPPTVECPGSKPWRWSKRHRWSRC